MFLSGGIDSSLVLDACHRVEPAIEAFSVSMSESDFDEWGKAELVLDTIGVQGRGRYLMDRSSVVESLQSFFAFWKAANRRNESDLHRVSGASMRPPRVISEEFQEVRSPTGQVGN